MNTALGAADNYGPSHYDFIELRLVNGSTLRGHFKLIRDSSGHPSYFASQYPPFAVTPAAVVIQAIPILEPQP